MEKDDISLGIRNTERAVRSCQAIILMYKETNWNADEHKQALRRLKAKLARLKKKLKHFP